MIRPSLLVLTLLVLTLATQPRAGAEELPDREALRGWIEAMKERPRGPFSRLRWFCEDGQVLPPEPFACKDHGGGVQHGEWTPQVKALRANGYMIANVLADLDVEALVASPEVKQVFGQMLIEQFLIRADDGWILRQARYYRGAFQEEGERWGAGQLLLKLAEDPAWLDQHYLALRSGAEFLDHGADSASSNEVRQLSAALSKKDPAFEPLRNKIHGTPEAADAGAVRDYAAGISDEASRADYLKLADLIDQVYSKPSAAALLVDLAGQVEAFPAFAEALREAAARLDTANSPAVRFETTAGLLALLRDNLAKPNGPKVRLAILDASREIEIRHFTAATKLAQELPPANRQDRLIWLTASTQALYGSGLISRRQREALFDALGRLYADAVDLKSYKDVLDYLALAPGWCSQWVHFHFKASVDKLAEIEPAAELFPQDLLRGSALFFYAKVLDSLLRDANRLAGVRNELFGQDVGAGLRSLNPGLARGRLHLGGGDQEEYRRDGIYLLPETVAELPPVAGILTLGEGNALSHVQLLARNLGIPNVALDEALVEKLRPAEGREVILAASAAGAVRLFADEGQGETIFGEESEGPGEALIRPDLEKLDLAARDPVPLSRLRAAQSGRIVGPKAAKLGELKHSFSEAVAEGLAIPFGVFRVLLDQPFEDSGGSVYDWMVGEYRRLAELPRGSAQRDEETERFRQALYRWILEAEPGEEFRRRLAEAMDQTFGPDGSYGVFVRSDTNVEDLPGFTGAGLNLTVPNVVGFENVMDAVRRVWASPFTARAFAWRQSHMDQPEHVYPAILLMRSVPSDKSGVLVTQDIDSGEQGWLSVAVNQGVGGAVDGQAAEALRIRLADGEVKLLAEATAPLKRRIDPAGGVDKVPVDPAPRVLEPNEIDQLIALAEELPRRFPAIVGADGEAVPADIEFGFEKGELRLFQIRPFLESKRARNNAYLQSLDVDLDQLAAKTVDMNEIPGSAVP